MKSKNGFLLVIIILSVSVAWAVPVQWKIQDGGNGHFYEPVPLTQPIVWTQARDAAITAGGYLCTITSEPENNFVFDLVSGVPGMWTGNMGPWLGGFQVEGASEPNGGWQWVTGTDEPFDDYTNWAPGQPDDMSNAEHWLHFYGIQYQGQWNDTGYYEDHVYSYVVEYIPEPSTLLLLGFGGLALRRKHRAK